MSSEENIVDSLSEKLSPEKTYYALALLERKGYIMEAGRFNALAVRITYSDSTNLGLDELHMTINEKLAQPLIE